MANRWQFKSMIERFEEKFIPVTESGCWLWTACVHGRGYGMFHTGRKLKKGKMEFAHRVSYEIYNGYRPSDDEEICHKCDNTTCVNPNHLFIGSHTDNMQDMMKKERYISPREKLSKEDVDLAIKLRDSGLQVKEIAEIFNINTGHASRITRGFRKHFNK